MYVISQKHRACVQSYTILQLLTCLLEKLFLYLDTVSDAPIHIQSNFLDRTFLEDPIPRISYRFAPQNRPSYKQTNRCQLKSTTIYPRVINLKKMLPDMAWYVSSMSELWWYIPDVRLLAYSRDTSRPKALDFNQSTTTRTRLRADAMLVSES